MHGWIVSRAPSRFSFWHLSRWVFFASDLAHARMLVLILWVLILFQLFVYWSAKRKRADIAEFAVKRLQTTLNSMVFVVFSDFAITTYLISTLPLSPPQPELKRILSIFLLDSGVFYGLSLVLGFVITNILVRHDANIHKIKRWGPIFGSPMAGFS